MGSTRGVPDVAALANPETGVWVYDSGNGGWGIVGGTSVASPLQAGVTNASKSFSASTAAELARIYAAKQSNANAFGARGLGLLRPSGRLHRRLHMEFLHGRRRFG